MKSQSSIIQPSIWLREVENGIRHVTLRKNFIEKQTQEGDSIYEFDETNIYIPDRENAEEYVNNNFDVLFEQGLINEIKPKEPSIDDRLQAIENAIINLL